MQKGRALDAGKKESIVSLKSYFDRNKKPLDWNDSSAQMVADALDIGLVTVNRVLANYKKDPHSLYYAPKEKGRPSYAIASSYEEQVRSYIRDANLQGKYITLETISKHLSEQNASSNKFYINTLARTLDRWGFEFGKGKRTQHLKEKDHVIAARRRYIRIMKNNRKSKSCNETIRPEVYLDESYVNKNHSNDYIWYSHEDGPLVQKPTGKGERLIIINAITKNGWVPNAKLIFKSTRKTGDYHGQMNYDNFKKWFTEKLLPNIPGNSNIIMDNAPYHNILSVKSAPTPSCSKEKIITWLQLNKVPCDNKILKAELIELLNKFVPVPTFAIDEIAQEHGHVIIRTPPYHPELQPIEICWGVLKNEIARNCNFTMENLEIQLQEAFTKVTKDTCEKIISKIRKIEDKFWSEDIKIEEKAKEFSI